MEIQKHHRILITGGKGFLGTRLYNVLKHRGYEHVFAVGGTRSGTIWERSLLSDGCFSVYSQR